MPQDFSRIVIIDPSCKATDGHHLTSLLDLSRALAPLKPLFLVHQALPANAFPGDVPVERVFAATAYDAPGLGPRPKDGRAKLIWKLRRAAMVTALIADQARVQANAAIFPQSRLSAEDWAWSRWRLKWPHLAAQLASVTRGPVDHIVVPSSDIALICGLIDQRAIQPNLADTQIHARFITLPPNLGVLGEARGASPAYRQVMARRLQGLHLYVETPAMQRHLAQTFGLSSDVFPYLLSPPDFDGQGNVGGVEARPASFGYFGAVRSEKGFHRLRLILRRVAQLRGPHAPEMSFFIHVHDARRADLERLEAEVRSIETDGFMLELTTGVLPQADYRRRLSSVDAILLPYKGTRYRLSGSGILCEALALGKAVIFTRGLSFRDTTSTDNAIEAGSDEEFARAIHAMAEGIEAFRHGAAARARHYASEVASCPLLVRLRGSTAVS